MAEDTAMIAHNIVMNMCGMRDLTKDERLVYYQACRTLQSILRLAEDEANNMYTQAEDFYLGGECHE